MSNKLCELSLKTLRRLLRDTERSAGPDSKSAAIIRREIDHKQWLASLPTAVREILAVATDPNGEIFTAALPEHVGKAR